MYNRYIGNTGKFVRVEDSPRVASNTYRPGPNIRGQGPPAAVRGVDPPAVHQPPPIQNAPGHSPAAAGPVHAKPPVSKGKSSLLGGLGGGLKSLLGGLGSSGGLGGSGGLGLGGLTGNLKGMFDHLPFGLELGDLLLLAVLFFFFMESGDEEFIIILAFFAFSIYKDSKAV